MTGPVGRTRRELLAVAGVAGASAVAGCGALGGLLGGDPTVDGDALVDTVTDDWSGIDETVPVDIERSFAATHRDRAETLLSRVPTPLDRTAVPNGVVREHLADRYDEAQAALGELTVDDPTADALEGAEYPRGKARAAAATWAAVDGGVDAEAEAVRDEMTSLRSDFDAFRDRWRYVGDDPVAAVVTYGVMEDWLAYGPRALGTPDGPADALWVGEFAADVERARTNVENLRYLFDRHTDTLSAERSLQSTFLDVGGRLEGRVDRRKANLSSAAVADALTDYDEGSAETPAHAALGELAEAFQSRNRDRYNRSVLAAAEVLGPHENLTEIGAFEWLRDRIEADEQVMPTGIEDVRRLRTSAIEAIRAADGGSTPHLRRQVLDVADNEVGYADHVLRDAGKAGGADGVSLPEERDELSKYVQARALANAVGDASETVATALRSE